jgi:hypothetical protein
MRLPLYGSLLAVVPILTSHGISHAASEQNTPAPGLSAQAIAQYEAIPKNLSPETLNSLLGEALDLVQVYSGAKPGSAEWAELKRHKGELQDLKARLCAGSLIAC